MHEERDVVRDLPIGLLNRHDPSHGNSSSQPIHGRGGRVGVSGAHRSGTGLHRLEHGSCLNATNLAHHQTREVLTQCLRNQVGDGELAHAMPVHFLS